MEPLALERGSGGGSTYTEVIAAGQEVREDSKILKSFGLDKEMISANGSVCAGGIKSRNVPGTGPQGCHRALGLLLPTEARACALSALRIPPRAG